MFFPGNSLATFDLGALGTVKDEEGEKWSAHEAGATKKQSPQFRILAFSSISGMEEPDGGIDSKAKAPEIGRVSLESVNDSEV